MAKQPITPGLVAEALAQLPERIIVGPYPIRIKLFEPGDPEGEGHWGQFDANEQVIWLNRNFPSLTFMGMIFTHELLHAVWWAQGLNDDGEPEERVVTLISTGITQVYRDNPWLLDWIALSLRFDRVPPANGVLKAQGTKTGRWAHKATPIEEVSKPRAAAPKAKKPRATAKAKLGFLGAKKVAR